ncbi:MAG: diguanylate cyclase [Defluviitaleaceae bacterium]|nr:diguanylate cyclase [Defluviitaleaceae bacterium]
MDHKEYTVLIIDDQETSITALSRILETQYTIRKANNGIDGIGMAEAFQPDVILLDIMMIDMDGYAVITQLKKNTATKDIPVIFITALYGDENEEKGLALGAADYIIKPFSPAIVKLRIRNQIKMLDQFREIQHLSMHDQLTRLPNRRNFENRLCLEWRRSHREGTPLSLMMIDIDRFKNYNDTYGHQQGDVALQTMKDIFDKTLKRPTDMAARWGGEEFIALLPNTDLEGSSKIAEELRGNTEASEIMCPMKNTVTRITVSIGLCVWTPDKDYNLDEFISQADTLLYNAKNMGRNQVCF